VAGEGCLSLEALLRDGHHVDVERSVEIDVRWRDLDGEVVERTLTAMDARIFQHEIDHLDGILTIDRAAPEVRREAMRRLRERLA
jgi:peptide deformylase